ncbi:hypothetical protein [Aeribacillus alveayuensis]|uniref:Uncharacterized protein n=1 Tax=Aeribacillus alveayuensis TaxID=279215 RepID=A0ABT9VQS2_9BACI|nr:hypothetical protein [Bacillus alveayuensis]
MIHEILHGSRNADQLDVQSAGTAICKKLLDFEKHFVTDKDIATGGKILPFSDSGIQKSLLHRALRSYFSFNPEFVAGTTSKRTMEKAQSKKI